MENAYEWYTSGPRQRLQPGGRIIVVMTRWSVADLTGKLMKAQKEPKQTSGSDRIPRNITVRQTSMARILEIRRIRSGESIRQYTKMECTVPAKPNSR